MYYTLYHTLELYTLHRVNLLRMLCGSTWGASKKCLLSVYRSLVRSVIEYGCEIQYSASVKALKILQSVQSQCLRICTGACRSTPLIALQNECGELPLHIRRAEILMRHAIRIKTCNNNPAVSTLDDTWHNYIPRYMGRNVKSIISPVQTILDDITARTVTSTPPWLIELPTIDDTLAEQINKKTHLPHEMKAVSMAHIEQYDTYYNIYTDGSCFDEQTTSSMYSTDHMAVYHLPNKTDIMTAELLAIQKAVEYSKDVKTFENIAILTDSLSCVKLIGKYRPFAPDERVCNLINAVHESHAKGNHITIVWIPSHVGIPGNETADNLAKQAHCIQNKTYVKIPSSL